MNDDYGKIVNILKKRKKGATVADVCADTALPIETVRALLPKAADEYSAHLQIKESGEILYDFKGGFISRYHGAGAKIKKAFSIFKKASKTVLIFLFKVWIMVMLIGYFLLFIALVLASIFLSAAAQSKSSSSSRRSSFFGIDLFTLIWRMWFLQDVLKPRNAYAYTKKKNTRAMHKAIFSFVFGEENNDKIWQENENKSVISYIQANRGVISLAEYMIFTGKNSNEAQEDLLAFCSRYGGSPESTDEGTIVYRFDDLLLRDDLKNAAELSPAVKQLKVFSYNSKKMNVWFIVINAVNLVFGSYFLFNSLNTGVLLTQAQYESASYLYAFTHMLFELFTQYPAFVIFIGLGIVPFVFSLLFWIIPAVRSRILKNENEEIKLSNYKKLGFNKIWNNPLNFRAEKIKIPSDEFSPKNIGSAQDRLIKDFAAVSNVDVEQSETGEVFYSFNEVDAEKKALEKYRNSIDPERQKLGSTVFDTSQRV